MSRLPDFFVVLPGSAVGTEESVSLLSRTAGIPVIEARLALNSRFPRRIAECSTQEEAVDLVMNLRAVGFDAFPIPRGMLERPPFVVEARGAALGPDFVRWTPFESAADPPPELGRIVDRGLEQRVGQLRWIFHGTFESAKRITTDTLVQDPYSTCTPYGFPRSRSSETVSGDSIPVLLLFGATPHACVVVRSPGFNFQCLGSERALTGGASLIKLKDRLRSLFPECRYDDLLLKSPLSPDPLFSQATVLGSTTVRHYHGTNERDMLHLARLMAMERGIR